MSVQLDLRCGVPSINASYIIPGDCYVVLFQVVHYNP